MVAIKDGQAYALELKIDGKAASPKQIETMLAMQNAGAVVACAAGLNAALAKLEDWGLI